MNRPAVTNSPFLDAPGLGERLRAIRGRTLALAAPLSAEDCVVQSMPDASPVKWHLAHTTWFFEQFVLVPYVSGYVVAHPSYAYLFNSYYEGVGARPPRAQRGLLTRPALPAVLEYRRRVDDVLASTLDRRALPGSALALVELGLHHEQQHQELLLTDVKHLLSCNESRPAYLDEPLVGEAPLPASRDRAPSYVRFPGGLVDLGHDGSSFSFDNERPRHRVFLEPFELASAPVTNGDLRNFVRDGGYRRPELWLADGFATVEHERWTRPMYWDTSLEAHFTLRGVAPIVAAAPVAHLSYYEADAFARWAGARLPTEHEWEHAAATSPVEGNFLESGRLTPSEAASGAPSQLFGDVWEWTSSAYLPYPGFAPEPGAVGEYNGKFMVGQHVLRGGSCASPRSHLRATYRNFFPPPKRWQFSGARLARAAS